METTVGRTIIRTLHGNLLTMEVDAIVNAANERLAHAGGLAGAMVEAGGEVIQDESDVWVLSHGPLHPGLAAVTGSGTLPCAAVVHVAGPVYRQGRDNEGLLRAAVQAALAGAVRAGARTVAMPAISAGIFGYPREEATAIIADETLRWADEHPNAFRLILLVGYDEAATADFAAGLEAAVSKASAAE